MKTLTVVVAALAVIVGTCGLLHAQGVAISQADRHGVRDFFTITRQEIHVRIRDNFAETTIHQWIKNVSQENAEAVWMFAIPDGGTTGAFEMFLGEQKMAGQVLPANEARAIYDQIVRSKRDPALLEFVGRGMFRTSVFPFRKDEEKQLKLTYGQLLKGGGGLTRYFCPVGDARFSRFPVEKIRVVVDIETTRPMRNLYSPSHDVTVIRADDRRAQCIWEAEKPSQHYDVELFYATEDAGMGADVLTWQPQGSEDGWFLYIASPKPEGGKVSPKDVVFVVDHSGSMAVDGKMGQARNAVAACVGRLRPDDRFAILAFGNGVDAFAPTLQRPTPENLVKARMFLNGIIPSGGTNISGALARAFDLVDPARGRMTSVVLITDGVPTVGERDIKAIVDQAGKRRDAGTRIFSFGVGYDVNTVLLDRLASDHRGFSDYIEPGQSLQEKVAAFFGRVGNPVMTDLKFDAGDLRLFDVYPSPIPDAFAGDQVVVCGRFRGKGRVSLALEGTTASGPQRIEWSGAFDGSSDPSRFFIERLWGSKQVGFLVDQVRFHGASKEVVDEIVRLSVKYGIVTEYTSFLIREDGAIRNPTAHAARAQAELNNRLASQGGVHGVKQSQNIDKMRRGNNANQNDFYMDEQGKRVDVAQVRHIDGKTLVQDGRGVWNDTSIADGAAPARRVEVRAMSEEYFNLLKEKPELNRYAAQGLAMEVRIGDTVYAAK